MPVVPPRYNEINFRDRLQIRSALIDATRFEHSQVTEGWLLLDFFETLLLSRLVSSQAVSEPQHPQAGRLVRRVLDALSWFFSEKLFLASLHEHALWDFRQTLKRASRASSLLIFSICSLVGSSVSIVASLCWTVAGMRCGANDCDRIRAETICAEKSFRFERVQIVLPHTR